MRWFDGDEVSRLLDMESCIDAVEAAFLARGTGGLASSSVTGLELPGGGLHAKLGALQLSRPFAAAKINANFPNNPAERGLPTVQGVIILFDAASGVPLASMDSRTITSMRTAAASAVAARYLALPHASAVTFIGCGAQARAHVRALGCVRQITRLIAFDAERGTADRFAKEMAGIYQLEASVATDVRQAARSADIVVTSTPSRQALLDLGDVKRGTFIAAVGADNEHKQEIAPALLREAAVVVDDLEQCAAIGDLHHALVLGVMQTRDVRASLDQVVAGTAPGRIDEGEIIVFDSTGVAIEDVAAAALVYERGENAVGL